MQDASPQTQKLSDLSLRATNGSVAISPAKDKIASPPAHNDRRLDSESQCEIRDMKLETSDATCDSQLVPSASELLNTARAFANQGKLSEAIERSS